MRRIRTYADVTRPETEDILAQVGAQQGRLAARLAGVRHITVVASGKGGVGKSAVAANLAAALANGGARVGAADADLAGPSLARMLGAHGEPLRVVDDAVEPAGGVAGVRVMSMDLLLSDDAPLRWRAPASADDAPEFLWQSVLEAGALREFLADTAWGELDHLVIDAPPGADKLVRLVQLLPRLDLLLLVTTPSEIARSVVARSASLAHDAKVGRVAIVANMTSHVCGTCGSVTPLFGDEGVARLAASSGFDVLAEIPFDGRLAVRTDTGAPPVLDPGDDAPATLALRALATRVAAFAVDRDPQVAP
jgi:ATP-binding protein involved in chromosome partitioning